MKADFAKLQHYKLWILSILAGGDFFKDVVNCHSNSKFDSSLSLLILKYCAIELIFWVGRKWCCFGRALFIVKSSDLFLLDQL